MTIPDRGCAEAQRSLCVTNRSVRQRMSTIGPPKQVACAEMPQPESIRSVSKHYRVVGKPPSVEVFQPSARFSRVLIHISGNYSDLAPDDSGNAKILSYTHSRFWHCRAAENLALVGLSRRKSILNPAHKPGGAEKADMNNLLSQRHRQSQFAAILPMPACHSQSRRSLSRNFDSSLPA